MRKMLKIGLVSAVTFVFSGCGFDTIHINKLDNGSTEYVMYGKIKPEIKTPLYRGFRIQEYSIDTKAVDNKVKLTLIHDISFTQGTGTISEGYVKRVLFKHLRDFDITNLKTDNKGISRNYKHAIFEGYAEEVSKVYSKNEFINSVLNNKIFYITIKTANGYLSSYNTIKSSPQKIRLNGIDKLKKFALCLKNEKYCKDEEK